MDEDRLLLERAREINRLRWLDELQRNRLYLNRWNPFVHFSSNYHIFVHVVSYLAVKKNDLRCLSQSARRFDGVDTILIDFADRGRASRK